MVFQDKSLKCFDCGATYTFGAEEQEAFQTRGYTNEPKRCPSCRQARKDRQQSTGFRSNSDSSYGTRRQMFPATCGRCGKSTQVPFEPRQGRPVYCSECYNSVRVAR